MAAVAATRRDAKSLNQHGYVSAAQCLACNARLLAGFS